MKLPKDKKVYVIGMAGIEEELREEGVSFIGGTVRAPISSSGSLLTRGPGSSRLHPRAIHTRKFLTRSGRPSRSLWFGS